MATKGVATVGFLALPIACCAGLSLLLAAGLSAGALAALGGAGAGLIGLAAAVLISALAGPEPPVLRQGETVTNADLGASRSGDAPPLVEILYVKDCPNHAGARALVELVAAELRLEAEIRLCEIRDAATAERERFLGSPTIRVEGRDVEPGAEERSDYVLACRLYRTEQGVQGQPDERWLRAALAPAQRALP